MNIEHILSCLRNDRDRYIKIIAALDETIQALEWLLRLEQSAATLEKKAPQRMTAEMRARAMELVQSGETVTDAAARLGMHRNSLHNAGIYFGGDSRDC